MVQSFGRSGSMKPSKYAGYFRQYRWKILLITVFTILSTGANFFITFLLSNVIDKVSSGNFTNIWWSSIFLLVMEFAVLLANFYTGNLVLCVKSSVVKKIRFDLMKSLAKSTNESVSQNTPVELAEKIGEEKNFVNAVYSIYTELFSIAIGVAAFCYIAYCSWQIALLFIFFLIIILIVQTFLIKEMIKKQSSARAASDYSKHLLVEIINGFADTKTQNLIKGLKPHFFSAMENDVNQNKNAEKVVLKNSLISKILLNLYKFAFLVLSVFLVLKGIISFGNFIALFLYKAYVDQIVASILNISKHKATINTTTKRMNEILQYTSISKEKFGSVHLLSPSGEISIKDLTVKIGNTKILDNLSVEIPASSFIGIAGASGSGKSTLLKVLSRQLAPSSGVIKLDGINIYELDESSYKKAITMAPQKPFLFSLSIRENLLLAHPEASDEDIWKALKYCAADKFVKEKGGLDYVLKNQDLSGGELQRLALARLPLKGCKILLLDESTSALDANSQELVVNTIRDAANRGHTVFFVAHRVSTLKCADKILFIENGKIQASGTYSELYKSSEEFRRMADLG